MDAFDRDNSPTASVGSRTCPTGDSPRARLSVIIPAYNASQVVSRAIESAWACAADEVIVVDDGSHDDTRAIAIAAGARCISQQNAGAFVARERGAAEAAGGLLIFLDADDELLPEGVQRSIGILESEPTVGVCAGTVIGVGAARETAFPIRYTPVDVRTLLERGFGPWPPAAAVVRKDAYIAARATEPSALRPRYADDYELLIRLAIVSEVRVHPTPAARYSMFGGKSATSAGAAIRAKEGIRAHYAEYLDLPIAMMTEPDIQRAALIRKARGQWASGHRFASVATMFRWFVRSPVTSIRKLASAPWTKN